MITDPIKRALELRKSVISEDGKILVVKYADTLQGKDTSRVIDLMPNVRTGEQVFRAKVNVKEVDPLAAQVYGKDFFDMGAKTDSEIEAFVRPREFDFPLWFKHNPNFSMKRLQDYNLPFITQVGGCNFHDGTSSGGCWYCFVDDESNNGVVCAGKAFLSTDEAIDSMLAAREKIKNQYAQAGKDVSIKVMRTSGGEPTIVLDWVLKLWKEIAKRGLDFVGQLDSNLSTGKLVDDFERRGVYEPHILEKLAEHPLKVLTALKGSDNFNLASNVQSDVTVDDQIYSLKRFLKAGFDIYPPIYNPNPNTLEGFLTRLDQEVEQLSLRVHIGPLKVYGPTRKRLTIEAQRLEVNPEDLIQAKKNEWENNYRMSCEVIDKYLRKTWGVGYKQVTRSDVFLKVLKD